MYYREFLEGFINQSQKDFTDMSDIIWDYAEPRFQEYQSSRYQKQYMRKSGFSIQENLAGEETAFIAQYGEGKPVIAFLGEFDSLSGLSQEADKAEHCPLKPGGEGHGCGHHLLGTGALAAAVALKALKEKEKLPGTIRYYGCPAEENAGGKAYLVREGCFQDCDLALTWHPANHHSVCGNGSLANFRVFFTFHGTASHAAGAPHLGRSALDAVELMDVGVNYMREHMISDARIHYAITNPGGNAPNVVQAEAQVLYAIRAPEVGQVKELYERVCKIARGAALMTETQVEIKQVAAYSNYIGNDSIAEILTENMNYFLPLEYTQEELKYGQKFKEAITELDKKALKSQAIRVAGRKEYESLLAQPIFNRLAPYNPEEGMGGSTDVGDVSWVVPTGMLCTACWAAGTAGHSWQAVAQGKSSIAHKGMLLAAKVLACAGYQYLTSPGLVEKAKETWKHMLDGEEYPNPLPADAVPSIW